MRKFNLLIAFVLVVAFTVSCSKDEVLNSTEDNLNLENLEKIENPVNSDLSKQAHEKPNGQHYNLNIIGVPNVKTADSSAHNGRVIFVGLGTSKQGEEAVTTRIKLYDSADTEDSDADFRVLDANGTDGEAAFELPKPGYDAYVVGGEQSDVVMSDYSIFVRPLGKPGGWSTITTCAKLKDEEGLFNLLSKSVQKNIMNAIDSETGAYCSIEQVGRDITFRDKGKTNWSNVTAELTSIVFKIEVWIDENNDEIAEDSEKSIEYIRVPLFDNMIDGEYWKYDNNGLKLLQVRFYPMGTNVADADDPSNW